jgi:hypothetical protein
MLRVNRSVILSINPSTVSSQTRAAARYTTRRIIFLAIVSVIFVILLASNRESLFRAIVICALVFRLQLPPVVFLSCEALEQDWIPEPPGILLVEFWNSMAFQVDERTVVRPVLF